MPKFLSRQEIYELMSREMPEWVFAYSANPQEFYTTSDDDSVAQAIQSFYLTLNRIYDNYFPQTAVEQIEDWEIKVFGEIDSTGKTLEERRAAVIEKIRAKPGITLQDIYNVIYAVIGFDKSVRIFEKGCAGPVEGRGGAWQLSRSLLGRDTYLGFSGTSHGFKIPFDYCPWKYSAASIGLTNLELEKLQNQAYSYFIRIYDYEPTPAEMEKLHEDLTKYEPARSKHRFIGAPSYPVYKAHWQLNRSKLGTETFLMKGN